MATTMDEKRRLMVRRKVGGFKLGKRWSGAKDPKRSRAARRVARSAKGKMQRKKVFAKFRRSPRYKKFLRARSTYARANQRASQEQTGASVMERLRLLETMLDSSQYRRTEGLDLRAAAAVDLFAGGATASSILSLLSRRAPDLREDSSSFADGVMTSLIEGGWNRAVVEVEQAEDGSLMVYLDEGVGEHLEEILSMLRQHGEARIISRPDADPRFGVFRIRVGAASREESHDHPEVPLEDVTCESCNSDRVVLMHENGGTLRCTRCDATHTLDEEEAANLYLPLVAQEFPEDLDGDDERIPLSLESDAALDFKKGKKKAKNLTRADYGTQIGTHGGVEEAKVRGAVWDLDKDWTTDKVLSVVLVSEVTSYDEKQSGKRGYNPYALPQYLQAISDIAKRVPKGKRDAASLEKLKKAVQDGFFLPLTTFYRWLDALIAKKKSKKEAQDPDWAQHLYLGEGSSGFKGFDDPWKGMSREDRREANRLFAAAMKAMPSSPRQKAFRAELNAILKKYGIGESSVEYLGEHDLEGEGEEGTGGKQGQRTSAGTPGAPPEPDAQGMFGDEVDSPVSKGGGDPKADDHEPDGGGEDPSDSEGEESLPTDGTNDPKVSAADHKDSEGTPLGDKVGDHHDGVHPTGTPPKASLDLASMSPAQLTKHLIREGLGDRAARGDSGPRVQEGLFDTDMAAASFSSAVSRALKAAGIVDIDTSEGAKGVTVWATAEGSGENYARSTGQVKVTPDGSMEGKTADKGSKLRPLRTRVSSPQDAAKKIAAWLKSGLSESMQGSKKTQPEGSQATHAKDSRGKRVSATDSPVGKGSGDSKASGDNLGKDGKTPSGNKHRGVAESELPLAGPSIDESIQVTHKWTGNSVTFSVSGKTGSTAVQGTSLAFLPYLFGVKSKSGAVKDAWQEADGILPATRLHQPGTSRNVPSGARKKVVDVLAKEIEKVVKDARKRESLRVYEAGLPLTGPKADKVKTPGQGKRSVGPQRMARGGKGKPLAFSGSGDGKDRGQELGKLGKGDLGATHSGVVSGGSDPSGATDTRTPKQPGKTRGGKGVDIVSKGSGNAKAKDSRGGRVATGSSILGGNQDPRNSGQSLDSTSDKRRGGGQRGSWGAKHSGVHEAESPDEDPRKKQGPPGKPPQKQGPPQQKGPPENSFGNADAPDPDAGNKFHLRQAVETLRGSVEDAQARGGIGHVEAAQLLMQQHQWPPGKVGKLLLQSGHDRGFAHAVIARARRESHGDIAGSSHQESQTTADARVVNFLNGTLRRTVGISLDSKKGARS